MRARELLANVAPELAGILARNILHTPPLHAVSQLRCETVMVAMRDGARLATDLYLPPKLPAPTIAVRTPYSRSMDAYVGAFLSFARRGYVVVAQDCRGTGDSEPDVWDYLMYESDDGFDTVDWISQQNWFDGFLAACGASYAGSTQWAMALHPRMSTIVPDVAGLGIAHNTAHLHMLLNAYARAIGKGGEKIALPLFEIEQRMLQETLATGYFNEPIGKPLPEALLERFPTLRDMSRSAAERWLWEHYCSLTSRERAEFVRQAMETKAVTVVDVENLPAIFGHRISHDRHTLPRPEPQELCRSLQAPVMLRTGWYDWGLNDAFATWDLLMQAAPEPIRSQCRLFIGPHAHNAPGYHEGMAEHPELHHAYGATTTVEFLLRWYAAVREQRIASWPRVIYYLMGANQWRAADSWPPREARTVRLHLGADGSLGDEPPRCASEPDSYTYDPTDPPPTVGGSIISYVYPPGSVDVSEVQKRRDVLSYTTAPLERSLDVVGPLRLILYVSSSATDTDFSARLSDVFPDGRAVQLQSGMLRARYRNVDGDPELLEPGRIYRLEIDVWATANRFKPGHRLRLDVCSADFPRFERNSNRGGTQGPPIPAVQRIYRDVEHPSHLMICVLNDEGT